MTVMLNYGTAAMGDKNFTQSVEGLNTCAKVSAVAADDKTLTIDVPAVGTVGAFAVGDEVMMHVSGGANATYVGNYGFFTIASINGSSVVLDKPCTAVMPNDKLSGHVVQIIKVAQYNNVTVANNVSVKPFDYDGSKGGIVALRVRDRLTLNGVIDASKRGYHGGHLQPNSGGNNDSYNGGGGGSNQFPGGGGGNANTSSSGGASGNVVGTAALSKMYFGGSGGRGSYGGTMSSEQYAGIGGGIVYVVASTMSVGNGGRLSVNGGGSTVYGYYSLNGGGAGGCLYLGCPVISGVFNYLFGATGGGGGGSYAGDSGQDGTNSVGGGGGRSGNGNGGGSGYQSNGGGGAGYYSLGNVATASSGGAGGTRNGYSWGGGGGGGGGYIAVFTNANITGYTFYPTPYTEPVLSAVFPVSGDPANPAIVVTRTPQFKWQLENLDPAIKESFYQLEVRDASGSNLLWDSKKMNKSDFVAMPSYANLEWDKVYQWRVKVWDSRGTEGTYIPPQYFMPSRLPYISALSPGDENYKTPAQTSTIPHLTWTYGDPDGNPQTKFQVIVSNTKTSAVVHDTGIRNSGANYYDVPRDVLQNNVDYKWCVTVWDARGLSATSSFRYLSTNALPNVLTLISPTTGQRAPLIPVFVAQIGDDLENDAQHFMIQIADDAEFTVNMQEYSTFNAQAGWEVKASTDWTTFPVGGVSSAYEGKLLRYTWQSELTLGKVYYWRMAPIDAQTGGVGRWSEVRSFLTGNKLQFRLKNPIRTAESAEKIVLRAFYKLAQDGVVPATLKVEVCNNGLDASPTWEDATDKLQAALYYRFRNLTKTSDEWAVDVRFTIESNDSVGPIEVDAFGFAFM